MAVLNRFKSNWKIKLHTEWLGDYLAGNKTYPICLEIDPSNKCPLNCIYCCWIKLRKKNPGMPSSPTLDNLVAQAKSLGVKAIIWTGGGEPLASPATVGAIEFAKKIGLDNGLFTNAVLMDEAAARSLAKSLDWIRFHVSGSNSKYYAQVHRVPEEIFDKACRNISFFSKINKSKVNSGIGVAINRSNFEATKKLPYLAYNLGLEYFQGKLDLWEAGKDSYIGWWNSEVIPHFERVEKKLTGKLKVHVFNDPVTRKTDVAYCHAHRIITAITADGRVAFCKMRRDQKRTSIGNSRKNSLRDIFDSQRHQKIANKIKPETCSILASFCPYRATNEVIDEIVQLNKSVGKQHRNFF